MIDKTMTVANLLEVLAAYDETQPDDVREVLTAILGKAADFYYCFFWHSLGGACDQALRLAVDLVEVETPDDIDEEVASVIADRLSTIALFALEVDGLGSDTRARLEQIKRADAEPVAAE